MPLSAETAGKSLAAGAGESYRRSLRVALVVGTLRNLFNQPEAFQGTAPRNRRRRFLRVLRLFSRSPMASRQAAPVNAATQPGGGSDD